MRRGVWQFFAGLLLVVCGPHRAHAQLVQLAPPITSDELAEYAGILDLSDAQFRAIDPLYQQYLKNQEALLTGRVRPFEQEWEQARSDNPETFWTDESNVRTLHDRIVEFRRAAARIDDDFFESMRAILTDSQAAVLGAVRLLRARKRVFQQGGSPIRFSYMGDFHERIELRRVLRGIDLTAEERDAVLPVLQEHEQQVTAALLAFDERRHQDQYIGYMIEKRDWQEMQRERLAMVSAIRVSHRTAMERMLPLLGEENAAALREAVYGGLYPGITPDPDGIDRHLAALRAQPLAPEIREAVDALEAGYVQQHAALSEQAYDLIDDAARQVEFWVPTGGQQGASASRDILKVLDARATLNARTLEQLAAIVGDERLAALADVMEKREPFPRAEDWITAPWPKFEITVGGMPKIFWTQSANGGLIAFVNEFTVPREISQRHIDAYARLLRLDEDARGELQTLVHALTGAIHEARQALRTLAREDSPWTIDLDGRLHPPTRDATRDWEQRHSEVRRVLEEANATFLVNLAGLCETDEQRARLTLIEGIQDRLLTNGREVRFSINSINLEPTSAMHDTPDLVLCVLLVDLPPQALSEVEPVLHAYSARASSLIQQRIAHAKRGTEVAIELAVESLAFVDGANTMSIDPQSDRAAPVRRAIRGFRKARASHVQLNATTQAQIEAILPDWAVRDFRDELSRLTFPGIYRDSDRPTDVLRAALQLEDLSEPQRSDVLDVQAAYLEQYDMITQKWIDAARAGGYMVDQYVIDDDLNVMVDPNLDARFEASNVYGQCRVDRQELNKRVRQQLRHILDDAQEAAIGLAAEDAQ